MPLGDLHAIGDGADRHGVGDERTPACPPPPRLLDQGLEQAVAVADAAGDEVVELVGRHLLVGGAPADPQAQRRAVAAIAVEMDAIGAYAEERDGAAVELEQWRRRPSACRPRRSRCAISAPGRRRPTARRRGRPRAERREIAAGDEAHRIAGDGKHLREAAQRLGIVAAHQPIRAAPWNSGRNRSGRYSLQRRIWRSRLISSFRAAGSRRSTPSSPTRPGAGRRRYRPSSRCRGRASARRWSIRLS